MADPRLQWRALNTAQPNVAGLMRGANEALNNAGAAAAGILERYDSGQKTKGDQELARLLASTNDRDALTQLVNSEAVTGLNLSENGIRMLNEAQGNRVDWSNTDSMVRDRDGRLVIAQDVNSRASDLHGVSMEDHRWRQGRRSEMAGLSDEVVAGRLEGQNYGSQGVPQQGVQAQVYEGLIARGMPAHIAEGFMMNFQDESGFDIDVTEAEPNVHGTRGRGLYQLTGSRREQFEAKYGNDYSVDNQLDFLMEELNTTEAGAWEVIRNSQNAGEAGANIVNNFLRPAAEHARDRTARYVGANGFDVAAASRDVQRGAPAREALQEAVANSQYLSLDDVNSILNGQDAFEGQGDDRIAADLAEEQRDLAAQLTMDAVANPDNLTNVDVAKEVAERAEAAGLDSSEVLEMRKAAEALIAGSDAMQSELAPTVAEDLAQQEIADATTDYAQRRFDGTDQNRALGDIGRYSEDPTANLEADLGLPNDPQSRGDYDSNALRNLVNEYANQFNVEPAVVAVAMRDAFKRDPGDDGAWWEGDIDLTRNTLRNRFNEEDVKAAVEQLGPEARRNYDIGQGNLNVQKAEIQAVRTQQETLRRRMAKMDPESDQYLRAQEQLAELQIAMAAASERDISQ